MAVRGGFNIKGPVQKRGGYSEILKFPAGFDAIPSVVLDASTVASASAGAPIDRVLKAGTLLSKNVNNQYERYTGASGQAIKGVLAYDVEFADGSANSDTPAAMFYHDCVFRADRIVDFATHGPAARAALSSCKFE